MNKGLWYYIVRYYYLCLFYISPNLHLWQFKRGLLRNRRKWEKYLPAEIKKSLRRIMNKEVKIKS